ATGLGVADSSVNTDTTHTVITMTAASWAPGIWAGSENAVIQVYKSADNALVSSGADSYFTINSVSYANKTLTVSGTTTGIDALDTALASTATGYIHWKGAKGKEPVGLDKIISNSGELFGIDAAVYALWTG